MALPVRRIASIGLVKANKISARCLSDGVLPSKFEQLISTTYHGGKPDPRKKSVEETVAGGVSKLPERITTNTTLLDAGQLAGVPADEIVQRRARIYIPAKTSTQSGTDNTHLWKIDFDNRERWENPLMGWSSTGDPLSNVMMNMDFGSSDDAIRFCEKQGWEYDVIEPQRIALRPKAYADNFSWDKRTRRACK